MASEQFRATIEPVAIHSGSGLVAVSSPALPPEVLPAPLILPADDQLINTGEVNGTQRWAAPDQSLVQYRAAGGTLTFHAWKRSYWIYWSMGASVTADGENYDAAIIDSNYYMTPRRARPARSSRSARVPVRTITTSTNGSGE